MQGYSNGYSTEKGANGINTKGIFIDEDTAAKSGKAIAYVPSEDGNVYEIRNNTIGTFRAKAERIRGLTNIKAGFTPALPLFPYEMLTEIIAFFKILC